MNGMTNGHSHVRPFNGSTVDTEGLSKLTAALDIIYNPRTSNEVRQNATAFLEQAKLEPEAPSRGFMLAIDKTQSAVIRHYGLSLLEYPIRYQWNVYTPEQAATIRGWVVQLAENVTEQDPTFLRNKIARLWVDIAERSWVPDWLDMDEQLCKLWEGSYAQQELVLHILETLSDLVFGQEGSTTGSKSGDLSRACVEIFTSKLVLSRNTPQRDDAFPTRFGDEGWLQRLLRTLGQCLEHDLLVQHQIRQCVLKILGVLQSVMSWIILMEVAQSNCLDQVSKCLTTPETSVQLAAVEVLHALYHRAPYTSADIANLVCPLLSTDGLALLRNAYEMCQVIVDDLDEVRYAALKKLSEVLCALGGFLEQRSRLVAESCDVPGLLQFLLTILQNPSLIVSIPVLYLWTKLLSSSTLGRSDVVAPLIGALLETCSHRLLRYETLSLDSPDATLAFLNEDFDTMPERHAFVGNYRRFCMEVIEQVVRKSPFEAIRHILGQADTLLSNLYAGEQPFSKESFSSNSSQVLRVDAESTVVITALKSYKKWLAGQRIKGKSSNDDEHSGLETAVEQWCRSLLQTTFEDPVIQKRVLQLTVEITMNTLPVTSNISISICEHVFSKQAIPSSESSPYNEAVRDLQAAQPRELQKLATIFSDKFLAIYTDLDVSVRNALGTGRMEQRVKLDYEAFLYTINLRASVSDNSECKARLHHTIKPLVDSWQSNDIDRALADFDSFRLGLGLEQFPRVFLESNASKIEDWSNYALSESAMKLKASITLHSDTLPLLATRSLLSVSTDRSRTNPDPNDIVPTLWHDGVYIILPKILRCISYSHAFNNGKNWSNYPAEMQDILNRVQVDRVWQSGISSESRDDFYNRIRRSKTTLEGVASAVRGTVRGVREMSYWILHCMSNLGDTFYAQEGLPTALANALYADAHTLSAHQLSALLKLSGALFDGCPISRRGQFLPPMLTMLFTQLDVKISAEWLVIEQRNGENADEDGLDQEMKAESVLRALTHSAVTLVSSLLSHERPGTTDPRLAEQSKRSTGDADEAISADLPTSVRSLIISSPNVLEALILFCTHALRMHDYRCCGIITRVLRHLIPEFSEPKSSRASPTPASGPTVDAATAYQIREFFSTQVLEACITSLHEPYFADLQKDLAALIASILVLYSPSTPTPRQVLLSLPGMSEGKVDTGLAEVRGAPSERAQRGWVLKLLESVRGVSIHELGRIGVERRKEGRRERTKMQEGFMAVDEPVGIVRGGSPETGGLADLFG